MPQAPRTFSRIATGIALTTALVAPVFALDGGQVEPTGAPLNPVYIEQGNLEQVTRYADGSQAVLPTWTEWHYMCGSNAQAGSVEQLKAVSEFVQADLAAPGARILDSGLRGAGINVIFSLGASVPAAAVPAFTAVEAYIESQFSDPITVTITASYADLGGGGVIGATGSSFTSDTYANSRTGLINGMDGDDVIQNFLPTGSTLPVRFSTAATITNVSTISWNVSAYRATMGAISGNIGNMTFNTQFTFDYDPSNGASAMSFQDVLTHEAGHALGFTSAVDSNNGTVRQLDLFRFQRTDGTADYNPDDNSEFQARPRTLVKDTAGTSSDDSVIDFIAGGEFQMADGSPYQASHFHEGITPAQIMDPAIATGQTYYPNFYRSGDLAAFDAIGYDYPPNACPAPNITQNPSSLTVCSGATVNFTTGTDGAVSANYQWKKGSTTLVDDGVHIIGATTASLQLANVAIADGGTYNCVVTNPACGASATSGTAALNVETTPTINSGPSNQTANVGAAVLFTCSASGGTQFRWRRNTVNLTDDGRIVGSGTANLIITSVVSGDAGAYDCVVTNTLATNQCNATSNAATLTVNNPTACPGDLNGDRTVNEADLGILLGAWQSGAGGDLNGDNQTNEADLGILLGAWQTTCP
ncbi:MAG: NF038122 family metalloprotease [Phycisphaerae bacterium]